MREIMTYMKNQGMYMQGSYSRLSVQIEMGSVSHAVLRA